MKDNFPFQIELAYSKVLKKLVTEIEDKFKEIFLKGKTNSITTQKIKLNTNDDKEKVPRIF